MAVVPAELLVEGKLERGAVVRASTGKGKHGGHERDVREVTELARVHADCAGPDALEVAGT